MALQTIEGETLQEFISNFTNAVISGGRFKVINAPDNAVITKLEDYNKYTNRVGIASITGCGAKLVDIEDDYILTPLTINPITSYLPELTLGAYLMAIQHIIENGTQTLDIVTSPAKSRIPTFVGELDSTVNLTGFPYTFSFALS